MPIIFDNLTEEQWLKLKESDISSTEISALYDKNPYKSAFALFSEKAKLIEPEKFDKTKPNRMFWGRVYEAPTALAIADIYGVKVRKMGEYMRHATTPKMSASFDYEIVGLVDDWRGDDNRLRQKFSESGAGILEIKIVDKFIFAKNWTEEDAPLHIEFQVQQQMEVADKPWCVIVASIIGEKIAIYIRDRDPAVGAAFCKKITDFWAEVAANTPPEPNYEEDFETLKKLHSKSSGETLDFYGDKSFNDLCQKYKEVSEQLKLVEAQQIRLKAEILNIIKNGSEAVSDLFCVKMTDVKPTPPKIITPDMVGQEFGGRAGFRQMRIKELK